MKYYRRRPGSLVNEQYSAIDQVSTACHRNDGSIHEVADNATDAEARQVRLTSRGMLLRKYGSDHECVAQVGRRWWKRPRGVSIG